MRWNSLTFPSMRHGSDGTSGVSTETIRLLRWAPWPMRSVWSMSMCMPAPFAWGTPNRRGAAAKPAPRPRVFLRKSRLFFMVLPLSGLNPRVLVKLNGHWIQERCTATTSRCVGYAASRRRGEKSDAKNAERDTVCSGRGGRGAMQNPYGGEIGSQKLARRPQDDGTAPDHCHLKNNISPNVDAFCRDTVRLARLCHQHRTHGVNIWMIHGRVIVNHSRHAV